MDRKQGPDLFCTLPQAHNLKGLVCKLPTYRKAPIIFALCQKPRNGQAFYLHRAHARNNAFFGGFLREGTQVRCWCCCAVHNTHTKLRSTEQQFSKIYIHTHTHRVRSKNKKTSDHSSREKRTTSVAQAAFAFSYTSTACSCRVSHTPTAWVSPHVHCA